MPVFTRGCILVVISTSACSGNSTPTSPSAASSAPRAPTISSVALSANLTALNRRGASTQVVATATFENATTQDLTGTCTNWQSDNQPVVTINTSGLVTAQSSGAATISTTCQGMAARQGVTLNIAVKAMPTLSTSMTVEPSPEPPFLYRARFQYTFSETGGVYGVNVNFLNTQILNSAGVRMADPTNYSPNVFTSLWGTNHIGAGQTRAVADVLDYNGGGSARVFTQFTASVTDDLGNATTFSDTINESLSMPAGVLIPALAGRDPNAFRFVR
jgi:hypothetical protein